jgi:hypothetical protein
MSIRLSGISVLPLALCALLGSPAAGQKKKQEPQNSIESLFEGLPADLRKNVQSNQVRIDRVNDWLKEHVNGKGKAVEVRVSAMIVPRRAPDGTYFVSVNVNGTNAAARALGEEWSLEFIRRPSVTAKGKGGGKGGVRFLRGFVFAGVSPEDAEKLADLKAVTIQGKVQEAEISDRLTGRPGIYILLEDVRLNGKKLMSPKPAAEK